MRFSFPICKPDGSQYDNAREFFNLLQQETSGNYLIGKSNFWHGGIHISDKTAPHCVDRDMVRCMADGTVVAYRLNTDYHQSQWMGSTLHYSTGFVLVRHEYKSPFNSLRFYSLYMHVAPYAAYDKIELRKPCYRIIASHLKVRVSPDLDSDVIGYIDVGAEIEVLATRDIVTDEGQFLFAKARLVSKSIRDKDGKSVTISQREFWLALQEKVGERKDYAALLPEKKVTVPAYWKRRTTIRLSKEISARRDDSGSDSSRICNLKVGTELTYISGTEKPVSIHGHAYLLAPCQVKSGGLVDGGLLPETIWCCIESRYSSVVALEISDLDQVVACNYPVKAGDPIARLGLYESPKSLVGGKNTRHLVHLEIFSDDAKLQKFLNNDGGKQDDASFLKLEKGTVLYRSSGAEDGATFELSDIVLERDAVIPRSELKSVKDKQNKEWFSVQLDTAGSCIGGYVSGDTAKWVSQYDWAGLGFQTVKAADDFDGYLDKVNTPAFFKALYQKVAAAPAPINRDKIKEALTSRENRDVWSKLVVYHPSEWKATSDAARWSVLKELLKSSPDLLEHESERIDRSIWWDDVAGKVEGFDPGGVVWYFHPVGVLGVISGPPGLFKEELIHSLRPDLDSKYCAMIARYLNEFSGFYEISTPIRVSHFCAQVAHECGFVPVEENLNYSAERMKAVFGCVGGVSGYDVDTDSCTIRKIRDKLWTNTNYYEHNPEHLANYVYQDRLGNGTENSGDGYRYRGRGLIQLTGRRNYEKFSLHFSSLYPEEKVNFVNEPELLARNIRYAVASAMYFWVSRPLNRKADADDIKAVTRLVNGGLNGLDDRRRYLEIAKEFFNLT